jgi:uncharacterized protein (TIRG00374 family)
MGTNPPAAGARNGSTSRLGSYFVYALSLACLLWVYHDFDWKGELPRLARIHWAWVVLAVASDVLVYVSQAWRWNLLLEPVARVPLGRSVQAIYVGLFANEVLPLRTGELVRCYLQSIWNRIPFPLVLSSALIERLVDGVWLILGLALVTSRMGLPVELQAGGWILAALVGSIGTLVLFAVLNRRFAHHVSTRHRWSSALRTSVEGLHAMGRSRSFLLAVLASVVYLLLQIIPIHAMLQGFGTPLSWSAAAVVLVILRLGTVIPGPPGNVGVFHFFCFLALHRVLGLDPQTAKSLSGAMFFVITVPLLAAGSLSLALTGLDLRELVRRARHHHHSHRSGVHTSSHTD